METDRRSTSSLSVFSSDDTGDGAAARVSSLSAYEYRRQMRQCDASTGRADFTRLVLALRGSVDCLSAKLLESSRICGGCGHAHSPRFKIDECVYR